MVRPYLRRMESFERLLYQFYVTVATYIRNIFKRSPDLPTKTTEELLPNEHGEHEDEQLNRLKTSEADHQQTREEDIFAIFSPQNEAGIQANEIQASNRFFAFDGAYRPISTRNLEIKWQYLKTEEEEIPIDELDKWGMVEQYAKNRIFKEVYLQQKVQKPQLLIFLDHAGSMVAFEEYGEILAQKSPAAAIRHFHQNSGGSYQTHLPSIWYFHDVPGKYIYTNPQHTEGYLMEELLSVWARHKMNLLIYSDAGAARGRLDEERIHYTELFLENISSGLNQVSWLNPMPKHRWAYTSAEMIAQTVSMYPVEESGLMSVINTFKGKQHEVEY